MTKTTTKPSNETVIGGKTSGTTVDKSAATRKGQLRLTPARLAMLQQVKEQPNAVVTAWTSVEKNTVHAPTAERLALLGLLAITASDDGRVANITDLGVQASEGGLHVDAVKPAPAKKAPAKKASKKPEPEAAPEPSGQKWVEIVSITDMSVVKRMGPFSERKAGKVARGVEINLNHDEYCVNIVDEPTPEPEAAPEPEVKPEPEPEAPAKLAPLPEVSDLRGKDSRINPNTLVAFLAERGIEPTFSAAAGAKKLIARFSVPAGRTTLELTSNLKAAGCSVKADGDVIEVTNVRYNKKLAG